MGGGWGGGYGHIGKWIQENIIFMRFCCFKLSKKIGKLLNEQPTLTIAKCTLTGLVQYYYYYCYYYWSLLYRLRNLVGSEIWSRACVFSTTLLLPSTATHAIGIHNAASSEKQKTLAPIREILVHKHWTKVYSQKGLTAMNVGHFVFSEHVWMSEFILKMKELCTFAKSKST